tara:strand:+ start:786 stop:1085 length:300 start_codon:yes stop_codon:yes gene_type:complete
MEQTHTIRFANDIKIKIVGETKAIIYKLNKLNEEQPDSLTNAVELSCKDKEMIYKYFFKLARPLSYVKPCRTRYRDTKHAVNLGNSVWDSPYAIPLEDF